MATSLCCACGEALPQFRLFRLRCPACGTPHRSGRGSIPWSVAIAMAILSNAVWIGVFILPFGLAANALASFGALFAVALFVDLSYQKWKPVKSNEARSL